MEKKEEKTKKRWEEGQRVDAAKQEADEWRCRMQAELQVRGTPSRSHLNKLF